MEHTLEDLNKSLSKAKIALMRKPDSTFFTTVCFSLIHQFDDRIPTAMTNGKTVRYSPAFWLKQNQEQQVGLMLHETLHVAFFHVDPSRRGSKDARLWNQAADHVINLMLLDRGFQLPEGGLHDPRFTGMGVEEVYKILEQEKKDQKNGSESDELMDLDEQEMEGDPDTIRREIEDTLIRAAIQAKQAGDKPGSIPGEIELFLNKLLNPKLPWQRILQKYLQTFAKNNYTFYKPNRRFFPKHILPGMRSESLIDMAFLVDVSGSIDEMPFRYFISECASLLRMMKPKKMTLIQFDYGIRAIDEIDSVNELIRVKFKGGGGTQIHEAISWIQKNKPQITIIFTDGYFTMPEERPKNDVIWMIHDNPQFTAPYGKVIHYEMNKVLN